MNKRPPPPADFDENPEWTNAMHARAKPASEVHGKAIAAAMIRKPGRPAMTDAERKQVVTMRLSPDVLAALKATGAGWQTRADKLLRGALGLR